MASTRDDGIVLAGFSAGADLALRLTAASSGSSQWSVDAVIALSPNVVIESAFASAVLAQMTVDTENEVLPYLRRVVDAQQTLQEWADVSEYLARLGRRFRRDFHVLQQFALGISSPFETEPRLAAFARWYAASSEQTSELPCIFEDTELCRDLVRELQRTHKQVQLLGASYQPGSLLIESEATHFDLEDAELIERHIDEVVARIRRVREASA